eukprot:PhM_4_TR4051/c0_g1_i1/m.99505
MTTKRGKTYKQGKKAKKKTIGGYHFHSLLVYIKTSKKKYRTPQPNTSRTTHFSVFFTLHKILLGRLHGLGVARLHDPSLRSGIRRVHARARRAQHGILIR